MLIQPPPGVGGFPAGAGEGEAPGGSWFCWFAISVWRVSRNFFGKSGSAWAICPTAFSKLFVRCSCASMYWKRLFRIFELPKMIFSSGLALSSIALMLKGLRAAAWGCGGLLRVGLGTI